MKRTTHKLGFTFLILTGIWTISGCQSTNPGTTGKNGSTPLVSSSINPSIYIMNSLISYHDDEAYFNDASTVADESSLKVNEPVEKMPGTVINSADPGVIDSKIEKASAKLKLIKKNALKVKEQLQAASTVTVHSDGTFTVDPVKLKADALKYIDIIKAKLMETKTKYKTELILKNEISKANIQNLKGKNNVISTSDPVSLTNTDGSVTKIVNIYFENNKLNISRNVIISRTFKDNKVINADYSLETISKALSRTATRSVTINTDGSAKVVTLSLKTLTGGKIYDLYEERIVNSDGTAIGTGSFITANDQTYNFALGIADNQSAKTTSADIITTAPDTSTNTTVTLDENGDGTANLIVAIQGQIKTLATIKIENADAGEETDDITKSEPNDITNIGEEGFEGLKSFGDVILTPPPKG